MNAKLNINKQKFTETLKTAGADNKKLADAIVEVLTSAEVEMETDDKWPLWAQFTLAMTILLLACLLMVGLPLLSAHYIGGIACDGEGACGTIASEVLLSMVATLLGLTTLTISGIFLFMTFRIDRGVKLKTESVAKGETAKFIDKNLKEKFNEKFNEKFKDSEEKFNNLERKFIEKFKDSEEKFIEKFKDSEEKFNNLERKFIEKFKDSEEKFIEKFKDSEEKFNNLERKFIEKFKDWESLERKFIEKFKDWESLERKFNEKFKDLERKFNEKFKDLERKFNEKFNNLEKNLDDEADKFNKESSACSAEIRSKTENFIASNKKMIEDCVSEKISDEMVRMELSKLLKKEAFQISILEVARELVEKSSKDPKENRALIQELIHELKKLSRGTSPWWKFKRD